MTRGFVYLFRLEPRSAMRANGLAPVAFTLATATAVRSAYRLRGRRPTGRLRRSPVETAKARILTEL
jgi:hypothetical protein